jgi:biopolymer transport protein ExbD
MVLKPSKALSTAVPFEENQLMPKRRQPDDAHFDVTPMVDLVFMMNIFFLVTWIYAAMAEIDLPAASHCIATNLDNAVVVTIKLGDNHKPTYFLGDASPDSELNPTEIEKRLADEVKTSSNDKNIVLIKAEKDVMLRDVVRVATAAAAAVKGSKLNLAVVEKN